MIRLKSSIVRFIGDIFDVRFNHLIKLATFLTLGGCATGKPTLIDEQYLPLNLMIRKINCELYTAVDYQINIMRRMWLLDWQAAYTITLKANETGALKLSSATFPIALSPVNLLNLGANANLSRQTNRTAIMKFNVNLRNVRKSSVCEDAQAVGPHPFVSGDIGFSEWLDEVIKANDEGASKASQTDRLSSVGHTFQFVVDVSAGLTPAFTIKASAGTIGLSPLASGERMEDHAVDVVIGRIDKPAPQTVKTVTVSLSDAQKKQLAKLLDDRQGQLGDKKRLEGAVTSNKILQNRVDEIVRTREAGGGSVQENVELRSNIEALDRFKRTYNLPQNESARVLIRKIERESLLTVKAQIRGIDDQIAKINRSPEDQRTVITTSPSGTAPSVASQNPNITSTELQLTLERTLGNLNNSIVNLR